MLTIAFEGLPGAGKTTQAQRLADRLRADGLSVAYLPDLATLDSDSTGEELVQLFAAGGDPFLRHGDALLDTFLAAAVRAHIIAAHIEPAALDHDLLIEDRGAHTMYSYSLATLMRDHAATATEALEWLQSFAALAGPDADHAVWLRPPVPIGIERWSRRDGVTPTGEQRSFLAWVDNAYEALSHLDPTVIPIVVDHHHRPDDVQELVYSALRGHLPRPAQP